MINQNKMNASSASLMSEYQNLEEQWAQSNECLINLKKGCFDETAKQLLEKCDNLKICLQKQEERLRDLNHQIDIFQADKDFLKMYQDKNLDKESVFFSVFEIASGFRRDFLKHQENDQELIKLEPLVNALKKQMDEKKKIKDYLYECKRSEQKFKNFISEYLKENPDQKTSQWSRLKLAFSSEYFIFGMPEEVYKKYDNVLNEHYNRANDNYWSVRNEYLKKHEASEDLKKKQENLTQYSRFVQKVQEKKNSKGVVVFTARDYINGFRKKALSYKNLVDQRTIEQERYTNTMNEIQGIGNKLHIRQSEIEVLYADLIEEITVKVANLYAEKRVAFKGWLESKGLEHHPDSAPKNLFKL